jgi:hypothetical protein
MIKYRLRRQANSSAALTDASVIKVGRSGWLRNGRTLSWCHQQAMSPGLRHH